MFPTRSFATCLLAVWMMGAKNRFAMAEEEDCDFGPDALTNFFGTSIPQTCINVPYQILPRCFYTYIPESCKAVDNLPVVLDVHGASGCPLKQAQFTGWKQLAEQECFAVVWPSGNNDSRFSTSCFNVRGGLTTGDDDLTTKPCCCFDADGTAAGEEPNDALFLRHAIDAVLKSNPAVDQTRVYLAGHSNGCSAGLAVAAGHSEAVAAVCCHAGALLTPFSQPGYTPVPIWMAQGVQDSLFDYEGSTFPLTILSSEETRSYLAQQNGCQATSERQLDGASRVFAQTGCANGATVEVLALDESGHFPYSSVPDGFIYSQTNWDIFRDGGPPTVDTTALAWEFCSSHKLSAPVPLLETTEPSASSTIKVSEAATVALLSFLWVWSALVN